MDLGLFLIRCSSVLGSNITFICTVNGFAIPNLSSYVQWAVMDFILWFSTSQKTAGSFLDWRKAPRHCQTLLYLISESTPCFHLVGGQGKDKCRSWPNTNSMRPLFPCGLNWGTFRPYVLNFLRTSYT